MLHKKETKKLPKLLVQALKKDRMIRFFFPITVVSKPLSTDYAFGIETCLRAINMLDETTPFGREFFILRLP